MEFTIHLQVLGLVFLAAVILGAVANKTNFCTMGAVSDWVNMGDTGRLRAWFGGPLLTACAASRSPTTSRSRRSTTARGATFGRSLPRPPSRSRSGRAA